MDHNCLAKLFNILFIIFIVIHNCSSQNHLTQQQYFKIKPKDVNAVKNETIQLSCEVGNLAGLVQWSKDGFLLGYESQIPGYPRYNVIRDFARGTFNLQIQNVQLEDEGDYQCQVGPSHQNLPIRAGALVSVSVPPQDLIIASSSTIILPLKNEDYEPIVLSNLNINQMISTFNSSIDYTNYVQIINQFMIDNQNKSSKKLMKYRSSLPFLQLKETERLTLICNTSISTKPETKLIWLRNGIPIKEGQYNLYIKTGLGNFNKLSSTQASLTIFIKASEENIVYSCIALHPAQTQPRLVLSVRISVLLPPGVPKIEGYKEDELITAGDSLTLACICKAGNPPAQLKWFRDEQKLITNSVTVIIENEQKLKTNKLDDSVYKNYDLWTNDEKQIDTNKLFLVQKSDVTRTLNLKVKPEDHYALYTCQAINQIMFVPHFRLNSASIRLNVQYAPATIQLTGNKNALITEITNPLKFNCAVGPSNPAAHVKIMIDDEVLELQNEQSEMHYAIDRNSARISNSLHLEQLLNSFDNLNRKLSGFIFIANTSSTLKKISNHKQYSFEKIRQLRVSCIALHPLLTTTLKSEYNLQIYFPPNVPTLKVEPNYIQTINQYKRFTCICNGGNPVAKLTWYKQKLQSLNRVKLEPTTYSSNNFSTISTLDLYLTPEENGVLIFCEANSPALVNPFVLQKQVDVHFFSDQLNITNEKSNKFNQKVIEWKKNDQFSLICSTGSCNPACNIEWFFNNTDLNKNFLKRFKIQNEQSVSSNGGILTVSHLQINSIQIEDHNKYFLCKSKNLNFNHTIKKEYLVQVLHSPIFDLKINQKFFQIWENHSLQIEFVAKGHPNLIKYEFYFSSIRLINSVHFSIEKNKILFKNVPISLGGQYEVKAVNNQGTTSHHFFVNILYFPKMISATTLVYLKQNQTEKINCTVAANPINKIKVDWFKLIWSQKNEISNKELKFNDILYDNLDDKQLNNFILDEKLVNFEENFFDYQKEKNSYNYLWNLLNLNRWWSSLLNIQNENFNRFLSKHESLNSFLNYNLDKVNTEKNLIFTNDTNVNVNQQSHFFATTFLSIKNFSNNSDYLCMINLSNLVKTPSLTIPSINKISVREKRRPFIFNLNSLSPSKIFLKLKNQVKSLKKNFDKKDEKQNKKISKKQKIIATAELNKTASLFCTAIRGSFNVKFNWRNLSQDLGTISHYFNQENKDQNWNKSKNSSLLKDKYITKSKNNYIDNENKNSNYRVELHFNPLLPELITSELKLFFIDRNHLSSNFECLVSNELGFDSAIYEIRLPNVPEVVQNVYIQSQNKNRLVLGWLPGFDGGFEQQYIVKYFLKTELERAAQSVKFFSQSAHNMNHNRYTNIGQNLTEKQFDRNEQKKIKMSDVNELSFDEVDEKLLNKEKIEENVIKWRTKEFNSKKIRKTFKINWNGLLSSTGILNQFGTEKSITNFTELEFTDLMPSTEYYFAVLAKNRLGTAKKFSLPIIVRTEKETNDETELEQSNQIQSNLMRGEKTLGLINYGLLTNVSNNRFTFWALIIIVFIIILVSVISLTVYYFKIKIKKLTPTGSLNSANTVTTAVSTCTSSSSQSNANTVTTNLSIESEKKNSSFVLNKNSTDSNDKKSINNDENNFDENEIIDNPTDKEQHCIIKQSDNSYKNNVTVALLNNSNSAINSTISYDENKVDYQKNEHASIKELIPNSVYAHLNKNNIITNNIFTSNLKKDIDLDNSFFICSTNQMNSISQQLNLLNSKNIPIIGPNFSTNSFDNQKLSKNIDFKTRINKLSSDYKNKYIPCQVNDKYLLKYDQEILWNNNLFNSYYPVNSSSLISEHLSSPSTTFVNSYTPSPTFSSTLPSLSRTYSDLDKNISSSQFTPSVSSSRRNLIESNYLKKSIDQTFLTDTMNNKLNNPINEALTKTNTLINQLHHPSLFNKYDLSPKTKPKGNNSKVVSFQNPVKYWLIEKEDSYYE